MSFIRKVVHTLIGRKRRAKKRKNRDASIYPMS